MSISINDNLNALNIANLYKKNNEDEELNIFANQAEITEKNLTNPQDDESELSYEDYTSIITKSDFTYNVMELLKNGMGFQEAIDETKEQQFTDLFEQRLATNGGDPIEAVKYAKDRMSADLSEEDLIEFVSNLAAEYVSIDTDIAAQLNAYADMLQEQLEEKKKNNDVGGYKDKINKMSLEDSESDSLKASLSVDNSIQDIVYNLEKYYEEMKEDVDKNPEKYARSVIV